MNGNSALSLWDGSAQEPDYEAPLDGDVATDLAIVGGGFTGLSTALHAAQAGIQCHVLEAERIGYGGSGRNVGLVNAGLWLPPREVRAKLGDERGAQLIRILGEAPSYVFDLIRTHQIRCEAVNSGTIHAAHAPSGYTDLARRAEDWQRLGAPVELLSKEQARELIGSNIFFGGLLDHRAGTINPMGYARGLARAARAAGAEISTGVRVDDLSRQKNQWRLDTEHGYVTASNVVLATNAYTDKLWPGLNSVFTPIHYFQLATEPLGERAAAILNGGQGLWDTGPIMTSVRRDALGRIIVGSMGSVIGGTDGLSKRWANKRLRQLFPDLGDVAFESSWHGQIAMTPDHLPKIHKLADGLYTPIGYSGRGITTGTVFGKAMAELICGTSEDDLPLPLTKPKPAPNRWLMMRVYESAFAANQVLRSL